MTRAPRATVALAATLALAGLSVPSARADLKFNTEHDATYTLGVTDIVGFTDAQLLYNVADTVTSKTAGATGSYTVGLLGDASTFQWTGANGLTVSNVSTTATSATATLTSDGTPGTSGYGYTSNPSQGIISVSNGKLYFTSAPLDLATPGATISESIGLQGNWTASSYTRTAGYGISFDLNGANGKIENLMIGEKYKISNLFADTGFGFVQFSATSDVPEPGSLAMLAGMGLSGLGFALRLRRRSK